MKTNLDKYNHYKVLLDEKSDAFINTISPVIPEKFYKVERNGKMYECTVIRRYYQFETWDHVYDKKPTKAHVAAIQKLLGSVIDFKVEKAYFEYSYIYGEYNGKPAGARTSIAVKDVFDSKTAFIFKEDAELASLKLKEEFGAQKRFQEEHKKDAYYDYSRNGYKFLGWQNGWPHVYFDEDGNQTTGDASKGEKPKRSFGYTKEMRPEYGHCREQKHQTIEVRHNNRGTENTVSCPVCKVYWKYDSGD